MENKKIFVTEPVIPEMDKFTTLLQEAWKSKILTHNGPLVQRFEKEFAQKLNVKRFLSLTNGTVALQCAIKALELRGEIITTPFTWIATISAIKAEGCTPIFCDIDAQTFNLDPNKIEQHISKKTVAIMPVHVFGTPCDVETIEKIAQKHKLKVIYDAAHAIGATYNGKSIFSCGDISATSLHATKLLNTAEGGGCCTENLSLINKLEQIRFFGYDECKEIITDGFNAKMTEVHAALGIANLEFYGQLLEDRKAKYFYYKNSLENISSLRFQMIKYGASNYSYFPVVFETEDTVLTLIKVLNKNDIFPRRYFYPCVNTFSKIVSYQAMPIAENISKRVLCLPLYFSLGYKEIDKIINIIKDTIGDF